MASEDKHGHAVHDVNQITSKGLYMTNTDKSRTQTDGYGQKHIPSANSYSKQVSNQQQQTQMYGNPYQQLQPDFTPHYTCGVYRNFSKNCQQ